MGLGNWEVARGFEGLRVVRRKSGEGEGRKRKRQKLRHDQDQDQVEIGDENQEDKWELEWDFKVPMKEETNKLQPIRNTLEAFHHSLSTIFSLSSSSTTSSEREQDDFEPGISLSNYREKSIVKKDRRYILIEHAELLGDLAAGSGGGGTAGAAKETGMGSTFSSTVHRLAQLVSQNSLLH